MIKFFTILFFISLTSFGQLRKINGVVIDNASGKKSSVSVCLSENVKAAELKGCIDTRPDGSFEILIPDHLKKPPYKLTVIVIGRPKQERLIYDTTKLPIKIVLENFQNIYETGFEKGKYDPLVKLRKFEHGESSEADNSTQKTFKRNTNSETHELTLIYNESCGLEFKPTIKFTSDTLFIETNKGKASATEKTTVPRPATLAAFLAEEYAAGQAAREQLPVLRGPGVTDELDALFRKLIGR